MKIVVTSSGPDLDSAASPVFGRCPIYIFADTETMAFEAVPNPAVGAAGGAGIQAAQFVAEQGAEAVVTGNVGPNAFQVLRSANIPIHLFGGGTVREAVTACAAGDLAVSSGASAPAHAGMGMGRGRGAGRGLGMGMGIRTGRGAFSPAAQAAPPADSARENEVAELKELAGDLRKQLAQIVERLDSLEKGG